MTDLAHLRNRLSGIAAAAVIAGAIAGVAFYRGGWATDIPSNQIDVRVWLGPTGTVLEAAIRTRLQHAIAALQDPTRVLTERTTAYRVELQAAQRLLYRAVLTSPIDSQALQRLGVVVWELSVLTGSPDEESTESLVDLAAARAPHVPEVHVDLGELCYRMGRQENGATFMAKAVSLSPSLAKRVVASMLEAGVFPDTIVRELPRVPDVLIAIKEAYFNAGRATEFAELVEPELPRSGSKLFAAYGDACIRSKQPERLIRTAEALGPYPEREDEAERQTQLAGGYLATGHTSAALVAIGRAVQLSPIDAALKETQGTMLLTAGKPADAEASFRAALASIAGTARSEWLRPRLYSGIGLALDAQGKAEAAVDSYRIALELNPLEPVASARLRAINTPRPPSGASRR
jgi:tetratricopeptide (TPR) repeat protein